MTATFTNNQQLRYTAKPSEVRKVAWNYTGGNFYGLKHIYITNGKSYVSADAYGDVKGVISSGKVYNVKAWGAWILGFEFYRAGAHEGSGLWTSVKLYIYNAAYPLFQQKLCDY